jgi:hypothetical protein
MSMTRLRGLLVAALLPVLFAGCSSDAGHHPHQVAQLYDATVRTAKCADWVAAGTAERHKLVLGMRAFFGGRVDQPGQRGQVLANRRAGTLFDNYCAPPYAGNFSLYRIYGNSAGFAPPGR